MVLDLLPMVQLSSATVGDGLSEGFDKLEKVVERDQPVMKSHPSCHNCFSK
jgi:hypothetical protein